MSLLGSEVVKTSFLNGLFLGKIRRKNICILVKGDVEIPSDIHGVLFKKFSESVEECFKGVVEELKAAGHEIEL